MKKLLIVDDHPIFLQGIRLMINESPLEISVTIAENFTSAKQQLNRQQPDLLLLDLMLPDTKGFDGLQELVTLYPSLSIAILSSSEDKTHIQAALKHGVKGYIFKTASFDDVLVAVESLLAGRCYLPKSEEGTALQACKLTARQLEVLTLVSQGLSNKNIAKKLHISENTVKKHLNSMFKILNVKNRIQASQCLSLIQHGISV